MKNGYKAVMRKGPMIIDVEHIFVTQEGALNAMIDIEDKYGYQPFDLQRIENGKVVESFK